MLHDDLEEGGEWWEGGSRGTGFIYTYGYIYGIYVSMDVKKKTSQNKPKILGVVL